MPRVVECARLALVPCIVIVPLPTAAACDAEMPTLSACPGEATYGGPLEKPTGATLIPVGKFGKVMVTVPPNPLTGIIETSSCAPPPSCCRAMEFGERERLKSCGG